MKTLNLQSKIHFVTVALLGATALNAPNAHAHAKLVSPPPRSTDSGITTGPCGTDPHTTPTVYQVGSTVTLTWTETIHHTGSFQIWFSAANDANLSTGTVGGTTELVNVPQSFTDSNVPHNYSATVTLPSTPCTDCTIQLTQTNDDLLPTVIYYFSCADITLSTTAPSPTPSASPTTTPVVSGGNSCGAPSFSAINAQIIQPMCVSCHSTPTAANQFMSFTNYAGVMGAVNTASPATSLIYTVTSDGAMPQSGTLLTPTQEALLLQWIQAGAPNN